MSILLAAAVIQAGVFTAVRRKLRTGEAVSFGNHVKMAGGMNVKTWMRRIAALVLVVVLLVAVCPRADMAVAEGGSGSIHWTLSGDGTLAISGTGDMENDYYGFEGRHTDVKRIVIGSGVTSISDSAFNDFESLTSVSISNTVTRIGEFAFSDCVSLKSVTIPGSVQTIGHAAFWECTNLANPGSSA